VTNSQYPYSCENASYQTITSVNDRSKYKSALYSVAKEFALYRHNS